MSKAQELLVAAGVFAVMIIVAVVAVVAWGWYFTNCATVPVAEMPGVCMLFGG